MQKYFEKIIERLEEAKGIAFLTLANTGDKTKDAVYDEVMVYMNTAIEIVNQVAEEVAIAENATTNDGLISLPKEAFDRMIARMESESERDIYEEESLFINVRDAARIVHEIAEEYKHGHFGCNSNGQHEKCKDCGLRGECSHYNTEWFGGLEITNVSDVPDKNVWENDRWIPCSERLPKPGEIVMVCQTYSWEQFDDKAAVTIGRLRPGKRQYWEFQHYRSDFRTGTIMDNDIICPGSEYVIAWRPLPAPYQPKGEEQ